MNRWSARFLFVLSLASEATPHQKNVIGSFSSVLMSPLLFRIPQLVVAVLACLPLADAVVCEQVCRTWRWVTRSLFMSARSLAILHPGSRYQVRRVDLLPADIFPQVLAARLTGHNNELLLLLSNHDGVWINRSDAKLEKQVSRSLLISSSGRHAVGPAASLHAQILPGVVVIVDTVVFFFTAARRRCVDLRDVFADSLIGAVHAASPRLLVVCHDSRLSVVEVDSAGAAAAPRRGGEHDGDADEQEDALTSFPRAVCTVVRTIDLDAPATAVFSTVTAAGATGRESVAIVACQHALSGTRLQLVCFEQGKPKPDHRDGEGESDSDACSAESSTLRSIGRAVVPLRFRQAVLASPPPSSVATAAAVQGNAPTDVAALSTFFAAVSHDGKLLTWDVGRALQRGVAAQPAVSSLFAAQSSASAGSTPSSSPTLAAAAAARSPAAAAAAPSPFASAALRGGGAQPASRVVLSLQAVSDACLAAAVQSATDTSLLLIAADGSLLRSCPLSGPCIIAAAPPAHLSAQHRRASAACSAVIVAVHSDATTPHPLASAVECGVAEIFKFRLASANQGARDATTSCGEEDDEEDDDRTRSDSLFYVAVTSFSGFVTAISLVVMSACLMWVIFAVVYFFFFDGEPLSIVRDMRD